MHGQKVWKNIVGNLTYNNTCVWNQFSATWLFMTASCCLVVTGVSAAGVLAVVSLGVLRILELLLCSVLIWLMVLRDHSTHDYLNNRQLLLHAKLLTTCKKAIMWYFCSWGNNTFCFQLSYLRTCITSTAETAWASPGHSSQESHISAYKLLPGDNLQHCLKFPSG